MHKSVFLYLTAPQDICYKYLY